MTVLTCGRTQLTGRAEALTRAMREEEGFCLDVGCGRAFDLDDPIQHMGVYRCLECARFLCKPCILAHFEATNDAYPPTDSRGRRADGQRESDPKEVQHQRHSESGRGAPEPATPRPAPGALNDETPPRG